MTIAGFATGCEHGYLYLRGEYPLALGAARRRDHRGPRPRLPRRRHPRPRRRLRHRAAQGRRRVHLRRGDGALQLDRGLPRRAAQQAAVPGRRRPVRQADGRSTTSRRSSTSPASSSTAARRTRRSAPRTPRARGLFCLSGRVARPGPLRGAVRRSRCASVLELAGGVLDGRPLRAVLLGGAAGRFVDARRARRRDVVRGHARGRREHGLRRGHGVRRHRRPAGDPACASRRSSATSRAGSACPCRVGTVRQEEALARLVNGRPRGSVEQEYALLDEITRLDARRVDLRPRPDGRRRDRVGAAQARRLRDGRSPMSRTRTGAPPRTVELDAQRRDRRGARGPDDPPGRRSARASTSRRMCWERTLTPVNACRVCVVRGQGRARARAVLRAQGRGGHGGRDRTPSG